MSKWVKKPEKKAQEKRTLVQSPASSVDPDPNTIEFGLWRPILTTIHLHSQGSDKLRIGA
jgi:hypothetical protein